MMKKITLPMIVFLMVTVLMVAICELGCRIFWQQIGGRVISLSLDIHKKSSNEIMVYELIPNSSVFQDEAFYEINRQGWRDFDRYTIAKGSSVRIAAVGDSFTFGLGLKLEDTWPKQLERMLNEQLSPSHVEVLNFGVMGYDTIQEVELIKSRVLEYRPDIIILGYCMNDVGIFSREQADVNHYKGYQEYMTTGIDLIDRGLSRSKLFSFMKDRLYLKNTNLGEKNRPRDVVLARQKGWTNYLVELYHQPDVQEKLEQSFQELGRLSKEKQIPVVTVLFPELMDLDTYRFLEINRSLLELFARNGIYGLDLFEDMKHHPESRLRISGPSTSNIHPNAFGNGVASSSIVRFLREHNLF